MIESPHAVEFVMLCTEDGASAVTSGLDALHETYDSVERRNFDAQTSSWAVIATITVVHLPRLLDAVRRLLSPRRVSYLKVGDLEIHDPRDSDVDRILENLERRDDSTGA